ncbi:MAG: long-chain-fatty-acid--CoA ligase [Ktedonobacteraceae bacterium]
MIQDSSHAENPHSVYESRPWLKQYASYIPPDLTPQFANGLDMFLSSAKNATEQPALYYFDRAMSYAELDRASSALAVALQSHGIAKDDRVALYLQNTPQFLIAVYALWKVGAIAVMCNPMLKQKELAYHLNDSGAKGLICLESLYAEVASHTVDQTNVEFTITTNELDYCDAGSVPRLLAASKKQHFATTLDLVELLAAFEGQTVVSPVIAATDVAFLTYTSGTTGLPKGAMNTHANVVFNATVYRDWIQLGPEDVIVGYAPFFHITGLIAHVAVAALVGIPIIMFYRFDAAESLRLIEKWRGSFTVAAITAFIALLHHPDLKTRNISSLTKAYSGGAPVSPSIIEQFQVMSGCYIHNIYGMTETTSPSHATPLGGRAPVDPVSGALSVGVPVPNTICKIIDIANGQELPPGEVGELIIKGPQVVAGYWQKAEETAHAIQDGYLHTGDVALMDQDGYFYIVDRKKDMIIVSGYKVWPRDVEDVLYQHPAVREAAVIGIPDEYRGETVKAYVALKAGFEHTTTPQELIAFCRERMANYKYPRFIEILDELPKTTTGKFLRRELRDKARDQ